MVREEKGWRLDNIFFEDNKSLRQGLTADIHDFRRLLAKQPQN
jgi:hypothetical protein